MRYSFKSPLCLMPNSFNDESEAFNDWELGPHRARLGGKDVDFSPGHSHFRDKKRVRD